MTEEREGLVRAFFALPLPVDLLRAVETGQSALKKLAPDLRWQGESKLHVTLKFLGYVRGSDVPALAQGLEGIAGSFAPILARVVGLDAFPTPRRGRVLVLRFHAAGGAFARLAEALDVLAESAGVERETRPFQAHVTLARARPPEDVRPLLDGFAFPELSASFDRVRLYQSTLRRAGSAYDILHESVLGARGFGVRQ